MHDCSSTNSRFRRFTPFCMRSIFLLTAAACSNLALLPHIQTARVEWRRWQCHEHLTNANIYGYNYPYACARCRKQIATAIANDALGSKLRIQWINTSLRWCPRNVAVTEALENAAVCRDPAVCRAARDALQVPASSTTRPTTHAHCARQLTSSTKSFTNVQTVSNVKSAGDIKNVRSKVVATHRQTDDF